MTNLKSQDLVNIADRIFLSSMASLISALALFISFKVFVSEMSRNQ